jgi:heme/copper-type cytochrome/quinol oxidase subunit 3
MSLYLASSNDNPVRAHPADMLAEHWQEEESECVEDMALGYGFLVVFGATCFLFGTLFASAVMIVLAKLF